MPSKDVISKVGRLTPGEYWVNDDATDVQVGWISRKGNQGWFIFDSAHNKRAGPYQTLREASDCVEEVLADEFNVGSPAN